MSGEYHYLHFDDPDDSPERYQAYLDYVWKIDEARRAEIMFRTQGRATVADPPIVDHVLKHNLTDQTVTMTIENRRPQPTSTDGPIHGNLAHAQSFNARNTAIGVGGPQSQVKRHSPPADVKAAMVSQLLKQHGSPPHVRVTAGGRIVPNDLQPLGSPRIPHTPTAYGSSRGSGRIPHALPNGNYGAPQLPQGFLAYNPNGALIQFVDGRWQPVRSDAFGQPMYQIPPPNMPFPSANSVMGMMPPPMQPMVSLHQLHA